MQTIGDRIKWLRKEKCHLTQEIVGRYIGVGKATVQKYEKGVITNIPSDKIALLSEILETTPEFIMGWSKEQERFVKPNEEIDELSKEIIDLFSQLSQNGKRQAIDYVQFLLMREEKK